MSVIAPANLIQLAIRALIKHNGSKKPALWLKQTIQVSEALHYLR
ncbi:hypothetical protein [Leptolyngbya sp. FACHB-17]|nr:hypothetical protein [Leptolyngbya sp. FACHB-17]